MADTGIAVLDPSVPAFQGLPKLDLPQVNVPQQLDLSQVQPTDSGSPHITIGSKNRPPDAQPTPEPNKSANDQGIPAWAQGKFIPAEQVDGPTNSPTASASVSSNNSNDIPSWAQGKFIPADQVDPPEPPAPPKQDQGPQRSITGDIGHAAGVAGTGMLKGALGMNPIGMLANAPALGWRAGEYIGNTVPAVMAAAQDKTGSPISAGWDAYKQAIQQPTTYPLWTTNDLFNATAGKLMPQPQGGVENAMDTVGQFAGGGAAGGQSLLKSIGAGVSSAGAGAATAGTPYQEGASFLAGMAPFMKTPKTKETFQSPENPNTSITVPSAMAQNAVKNITSNSSYPAAVIQATKAYSSNPQDQLPGYTPSLGQLTQDPKLIQREGARQQTSPAAFNQQRVDNNVSMARPFDEAASSGNASNLGAFALDQMNQADAAATAKTSSIENQSNTAAAKSKTTLAKIGRYGETPDTGATGDLTLDAQRVRDQEAGDMYKIIEPYNDVAADHVTGRNVASSVLQEGEDSAEHPLDPKVKALAERILTPSKQGDTIGSLRGFTSQAKALYRDRELDPTNKARVSKIVEGLNEGFKNTVDGLALKDEDFYNKLNSKMQEGKSTPQNPAEEFSQDKLNFLKQVDRNWRQNKTLDDLQKSGAITQTGEIDPGKFGRWFAKDKNKKNILGLGEWGKKLQSASSDAERASMFTEQLSEYKKFAAQEKAAREKSAFGKLADSSRDPVQTIGNILESKTIKPEIGMNELYEKVKGNADALEGLRSGIAQYMQRRFGITSTPAAGSQPAFGGISQKANLQKFLDSNRPILEKIYGKGQYLDNFIKVQKFLQNEKRYYDLKDLAKQSNTTKSAQQVAQLNEGNTIYSLALKGLGHISTLGGVLLGEHSGGHGIIGMVGGKALEKATDILTNLHEQGIYNRNQLEIKMLIDPDFANMMFEKYYGKTPTNILMNKILSKMTMQNATSTLDQKKIDEKQNK